MLLRKVSLAQAGCLFTGEPPSSALSPLPRPRPGTPHPAPSPAHLCPGIRRESPRVGLLRCREEPPRLLGNRFQERFFLLRGRCLLLLKEKKVRPPRPPRERPGCWVAVRVEPCRPQRSRSAARGVLLPRVASWPLALGDPLTSQAPVILLPPPNRADRLRVLRALSQSGSGLWKVPRSTWEFERSSSLPPREFLPQSSLLEPSCRQPSGLSEHPSLVSFASQVGLHADSGEDAPVSSSQPGFFCGPARCPGLHLLAFSVLRPSSCDPLPSC